MQPPSAGAYGGGNGPAVLAITLAETAIAGFIIGLRVYTCCKITKKVHWDLFWAIAAFVCGLASQGNVVASIMYGLGNHADRIDASDVSSVTKFFLIAHIFSSASVTFGKIAIAVFLLRLEGPFPRFRKWILHFVWISNATVILAQEAFFFTSCVPSKQWWNFASPGCPNIRNAGIATDFQVAWSALTDTILALWPIFLFFHTDMSLSRRKKLGLCLLMGGGLITASINIALEALLQCKALTEKDWLAMEGILEALRMSEMWSIIILGSVPQIRVAVVKALRRVQKTFEELSERRFARRSTDSTVMNRYVQMHGSNHRERDQQAVQIKKTVEVVHEDKARGKHTSSTQVIIVTPKHSEIEKGNQTEK